MSSQIKTKADQLVKLLEGKNLKEARKYITFIDVEDPDPNAI